MAIRCSSFLLGIMCLLSVQLADTAEIKRSILTVSGWIPYGSRQFKFFATESTWEDAEKTCKQQGAFLASVHNKNEDNFIKSLIRSQTGQDHPTWLGGSQTVLNRWVWSDGSAFDFASWAKGEPNGSGRCLQTNYEGGWDDHVCTVTQPFVCAKQTKKDERTTPPSRNTCGFLLPLRRRSRRAQV